MRTSEVALQIYGCGHALETPIMYWKLLIEVRCRDIILCLADVPSSLLQFCHTQKTVCFGGVEPHVRVMPVQIFFDCTERENGPLRSTDQGASFAVLVHDCDEQGDDSVGHARAREPRRARRERRARVDRRAGRPRHRTPQNCCAPVQRAPPGPGRGRNASGMVRGS